MPLLESGRKKFDIKFHVALTYKLAKDNSIKFRLDSPNEVFKYLHRCCNAEPTYTDVVMLSLALSMSLKTLKAGDMQSTRSSKREEPSSLV